MGHSKDFDKISDWYKKGIYSSAMVKALMYKGKITDAEYEEIVGEA